MNVVEFITATMDLLEEGGHIVVASYPEDQCLPNTIAIEGPVDGSVTTRVKSSGDIYNPIIRFISKDRSKLALATIQQHTWDLIKDWNPGVSMERKCLSYYIQWNDKLGSGISVVEVEFKWHEQNV